MLQHGTRQIKCCSDCLDILVCAEIQKMFKPPQKMVDVFQFHYWSVCPRFPGSLQVLTSTYKLNLHSKAIQVLIFASRSLQVQLILKMHMGSYKRLSFFQVGDTGWFHTFTEFWNHSDIGWDEVWSRRCFPPCSFRSRAAKIVVARLHNNFQVSHLVAKFKLCKNLN